LEYSENFSGWSDDLTKLHEDATQDIHPIDLSSRADAVRQLRRHLGSTKNPVILEIGCSSGFLLRDLSKSMPSATLIGADVVKIPLERLAKNLHIPLMRFDLLKCPLPDGIFDGVVLLNVLEHIDDDEGALMQINRLLKPGGIVVIEVPSGPHLYDAYDKALMHFRRYNITELAQKIRRTGFNIKRQSHLGALVYPAFFYIKRRNQSLNIGSDQVEIVSDHAKKTGNSILMHLAMLLESRIGKIISFKFGIRCLITAQKKAAQSLHQTKKEQTNS
jgi:SAM-dependent methyltransferase